MSGWAQWVACPLLTLPHLPPHLTFFPLTDLICISSFCISCPKFSYFLSLLTSYSCPNVLFCFQVSFKYSTCRAMSMHLCWLLGWPSRKHSRVNLGITGVWKLFSFQMRRRPLSTFVQIFEHVKLSLCSSNLPLDSLHLDATSNWRQSSKVIEGKRPGLSFSLYVQMSRHNDVRTTQL